VDVSCPAVELSTRLSDNLGRVFAQDGFDAESGEAHYRKALALAEPRGMRPLVAHCHLGLGKLYRRTGQREQACEHLATATTMYREMDMQFWLEKAEAEMSLAPSAHATPANGLA
jgi:hypothetical protein